MSEDRITTPQLQLYGKLVQFPLFQGISSGDMGNIAANYRLGFRKIRVGESIVQAGEKATQLLMIAGGKVEITRCADGRAWEMREVVSAPYTIEPHRIFGLDNSMEATYVALTDINIIYIYKDELRRLITNFEVIRINCLNMMSHMVQKIHNNLLRRQPEPLTERIMRYIRERCVYPAGHKVMKIKMSTLAAELNDSRLDISYALHDLESHGIISIQRGIINVEAIEKSRQNV